MVLLTHPKDTDIMANSVDPDQIKEQSDFARTCRSEDLGSLQYEPRHEKTCLRGFRPGKT